MLNVEKTDLLNACCYLAKIIERSNPLPILEKVHCTVKGDVLTLRVTDTDNHAYVNVPIDGITPHPDSWLLPFQSFMKAINAIPNGAQITIQVLNDHMIVSAGSSSMKLPITDAEEFPFVWNYEVIYSNQMPAQAMLNAVSRIRHAISTEEIRYYLNGMYFETTDDGFILVATDGHRLGWQSARVTKSTGELDNKIIPRKPIDVLIFALKKSKDELKTSFAASHVDFAWGNYHLVSKLIDGTFPDYRRVIPRDNNNQVTTDAAVFLETVKRVASIVEKNASVKLTIKGSMKIETSGPEGLTSFEDISIGHTGDDIEIGFNAANLVAALNQCTDSVLLEMSDATGPMLITQQGDENAGFVLMPLRI
jgi:DNA polymerase-3 subunit beta